MYTIKSKSSLHSLKELLVSRGFQPIDMKENELETDVTAEREEEFFLVVGFYIAFDAFKKTIRQELQKLNVQGEKAEQFMDDACHYFQTSKYWIGLAKVWVTDYFKDRDSIHVESFATFNIKGLKEEAKDYVVNMLDAITPYEESMEGSRDMSIVDLFAIIRQQALQQDVDMKKFEHIHVYPSEERMKFQNEEGTVMDESFFMYQIGVVLDVHHDDGVHPAFKDAMTMVCLSHVFRPKTITIHKNLSDVAMEAIKQHEVLIDKTPSMETKIVYCEGCETCD